MTLACRVEEDLFARVREHFSDDAIIELTELIAWENASARFNRALGIPSQGLWRRASAAVTASPSSSRKASTD